MDGDSGRAEALNQRLRELNRLHEGGARGGPLLQVTRERPSLRPAEIVEAVLDIVDGGANAIGALRGPATARCWTANGEGGFSLVVPLHPADAELVNLWARGLARDSRGSTLPWLQVSLVDVPPLAVRQISHQQGRLGHSIGVRRLVRREQPRPRQAKDALFERLAKARPVPALAEGTPLMYYLPPADYPVLFGVLGRLASTEDLGWLAPATLYKLGVTEVELDPLRVAGLLS